MTILLQLICSFTCTCTFCTSKYPVTSFIYNNIVIIIVTCTQISACTHTHSHLITHLHTCTHSLPHNIYYPDSQMASNCVQYTTLEVNCGFARVAIRELTPKIHGYQQIDTQKRALEFRELFKDCSNYGIEDSYFEDRNDSMFNRDCSRILGI